MSLAALFDYGTLTVECRVVVQQKTSEIRDRIKRSSQDIVEIGERLIEVKEHLGHGRFERWLELEFQWSERTARNLMGVADAFKTANFADLSIAPSALYELSAPSVPEAARREAIERASNGNHVSHKEAKAIVESYKPSLRTGQPSLLDDPEGDGQQQEQVESHTPDPEQSSFDEDDRHESEFREDVEDEEYADPIIELSPEWSDSELQRKHQVENGETVLADMHENSGDWELIRWATARKCFVRIDRTKDSYPLGNPLMIGNPRPTRDEVIAWYRDHWLPFVKDRINWDSLRGKVLGCWCYPDPCHGDIILEALNSDDHIQR